MTEDFERLYADLGQRAERYAVRVHSHSLPSEAPARFDGPTITLDPGYDSESRCFYLAHALGSIAHWSTDLSGSRAVFDELHAADASRTADAARFKRAVAGHLAFEERASGHAIWLLADIGQAGAITAYTVFFRADMAAIEEYHRSGVAPVWREFYPAWKEKTHSAAAPFAPRPVSPFRAVTIPTQEVLREEDGHD